MTAPDSAPTVREAGDEGIAAVRETVAAAIERAAWEAARVGHRDAHLLRADAAIAALAPLLAERERTAVAEALREAGVWLANYRNGATGRRSTNAELHGQMIYERGNEVDYQAERASRAALTPETPAVDQ